MIFICTLNQMVTYEALFAFTTLIVTIVALFNNRHK